MDYQNTLQYLYESVPMFQKIGGKAYKPGLDTTYRLDEYFGHPHRKFKTIHIAGTNGKGSCSHTIAAALQSAGYQVGLFTSPHLLDFRERIRINGKMMPEEYVVDFIEKHRSFFEPLHPSFFELTTAMAFRYFADQRIDIAVIEVGMGGRLDCTNIIQPDLCLITSISLDHTQYLGNTLEEIASEKAGIIKRGVPVVIGSMPESAEKIFMEKAKEMSAPLYKANAEEYKAIAEIETPETQKKKRKKISEIFGKNQIANESSSISYEYIDMMDNLIRQNKNALFIESHLLQPGIYYELTGAYQARNAHTIWIALSLLKSLGYRLTLKDIYNGFINVCSMTGLMGRWQQLHASPDVICDTGHNTEAFTAISQQLREAHKNTYPHVHIVIGMVKDKDVRSVLRLLPRNDEGYSYYFTRASVERAMPENELRQIAAKEGLRGSVFPTVEAAIKAAKEKCLPEELIFVGGSNFIVADLLANRNALNLY